MTAHRPLFGNIVLMSTMCKSTKTSSLSQTLWYLPTVYRISESKPHGCFPPVMSAILALLWTGSLHAASQPFRLLPILAPSLFFLSPLSPKPFPCSFGKRTKFLTSSRKSFLFHQAFGISLSLYFYLPPNSNRTVEVTPTSETRIHSVIFVEYRSRGRDNMREQ